MEQVPTQNNQNNPPTTPEGFPNWPKWKQNDFLNGSQSEENSEIEKKEIDQPMPSQEELKEKYKNLEISLLKKSLDIPTEDDRPVEEIFEEIKKLNPYNQYETGRDKVYLENRLKELDPSAFASSDAVEQVQNSPDLSSAIEENQGLPDVKPEIPNEKISTEFQYENKVDIKPNFYAENYVADFSGDETVRYKSNEENLIGQNDKDLEILEQRKKNGEAINVTDKRNPGLLEDDKLTDVQNQEFESDDYHVIIGPDGNKKYISDAEYEISGKLTKEQEEEREKILQAEKEGTGFKVKVRRTEDVEVEVEETQKPEPEPEPESASVPEPSKSKYEETVVEPIQQEQIVEKDKTTEESIDKWEDSEEWKNLEDFRMDRILAEDSFKRGQIKQDILDVSIENYKHALSTMADKIKESLRKETGEDLDIIKEAELRLKINRTIFEELVEKENETYLAFLRNERAETTQDKVKEGLKNVLNGKVMKWYEGLSKIQKIALNFGSAGIVGLVFDAARELKGAEEREIEELKNSNLSVDERSEKLLEIKKKYRKDRIKKTLQQMRENTAETGKKVFMELVKNVVEDRLPSRKGYEPGSIKSPEPPPDVSPEQIFFDPSILVHEVSDGESTWEILEKTLDNNDQFREMSEAQKTYILSALTNKAIQNPEQYGLNGDGSISMGGKTDFTKMFEDTKEIRSIFKKAEQTVTAGSPQEESILLNNKKIEDWVKDHPHEALNEEKISEILSDKPKISDAETKPEPSGITEQTQEPPKAIVPENMEKVEPLSQEAQKVVDELVKETDLPDNNDTPADMDQVTKEVEEAKARLAFLEDSKKNNNNNLERSFNSDKRYFVDVDKAFNEEIDNVYGKSGLLGFGKTRGVDTAEWKEISRLPATKVIEYCFGDSKKSGLPPEIISRLSESPKHGLFMKQMDGLIKQTDGVVKPFENENIEQFIKRLGGYILRTHLQKMHTPEMGLNKAA